MPHHKMVAEIFIMTRPDMVREVVKHIVQTWLQTWSRNDAKKLGISTLATKTYPNMFTAMVPT